MVKNYENMAGCLERKNADDAVIYEDNEFYIVQKARTVRYYVKRYNDEDGNREEYIVRLNDGIVPYGFLKLIDKLLEYKWMYDELCN